nr:primase-helicase zinc-binding domain-containing protein [uncultured Cupriavidus sp.]
MKLKDLSEIVKSWAPDQWDAFVAQYLPVGVLTDAFWRGRPCPCPICGGNDRFTYTRNRGRGDWVCRKCNDGSPAGGDGLELVRRYTDMSYAELKRILNGAPIESRASNANRAAPCRSLDSAAKLRRIEKQWASASCLSAGDHAMRYLAARIPGLRAPKPRVLRLAVQEYWHEKQLIGRFPTIVAQFTLPDGRMATVHRTSLEPGKPEKATIVTCDGEILPAKRNDVSALPPAGGAVRLMAPRNGELGIAEGLETAYAAYMQFGVPTWYCLNRVLLSQFVVPDGLGIETVHIFADFDAADRKTGKSPGVSDALALQKRLRQAGFKVVLHRPKVRGTDFCDEWRTVHQLRQMSNQAVTA